MTKTNIPVTLESWLNNSGLPRLEARMLLQHVLTISHSHIIAHGTQLLSNSELASLNQLCQRRLAGEPLAYLLGWREFYGRRFQVSEAVLIPRPETEHLVDAVLAHLPAQGTLWDLGTGSGAIAVTIACERPDAQIWAADISEEALAVAQANTSALQAQVRFGQGSWYQAQPQPAPHSVDVIVSNPPYIDAQDPHLQQGDLRFEPQQALTDNHNGLSAFETIIAGAKDFLRADGWLLFEHGYDQGEAVRNILSQYKFRKIQTLADLAGLDRVTLGQIKSEVQ